MELKSKNARREIVRQIESYDFQFGATICQIGISIFIALAFFFLGAISQGAQYTLYFVVCIILAFASLAILTRNYVNVKHRLIIRESGMTDKEYEVARWELWSSIMEDYGRGKDATLLKEYNRRRKHSRSRT
jgi:hypothetical protein